MVNQNFLSLTLRQLRYAVTAAELQNVTKAAERLHVSQPSISVAIAAIEAQYGRKLFVRRPGQGIVLTAFGRNFVRESRAVLDQAARLAQLANRNAPVSGEVALGCFTDLAPYHVPRLLKGFGALAPGVTVGFRDGGFDALATQLESGLIDLALTYDLGLSGKIARMTLVKLAPYAMLPTGHPLARAKSVSLQRLARYPLILTDQALSWQHVLEIFQRAGTEVDVAARVNSFELQRSMVANGFGVAVAYTRPIGDRSYDGRSLVIRPISDPVPDQRILLAWSKQTPLSPGSLAFRDFAKSSFAGS